jgi:hypothetical protein
MTGFSGARKDRRLEVGVQLSAVSDQLSELTAES